MLRQRYAWRGVAMFPSSLHCRRISSCRFSETISLIQFKLSLKYLHHVGISDSRCSTQHVSHRRTITVDLVKQGVNTLGKKKKETEKRTDYLDPHVQAQSLPVHGCLCPDCLCTDLPFETSTQNVSKDYGATGVLTQRRRRQRLRKLQ